MREYSRRVNLALEYMQEHLDANPPLREIARAACFSEYHFHRIFHAFTGETVAACQRRLRLNRAAWRLRHRPERPITEISLDAGFASASDFARAFRRQFAANPTQYRARPFPGDARPAGKETFPEAWRRRVEATISVTELPEIRVAYLRCKGLSRTFRNGAIRDAYASLYRWADARGCLARPVLPLGIYLDTPDILAMGDCRYLACIAVDGRSSPDGEIGVTTVGGGCHVSVPFRRFSPRFPSAFLRTSLYLYRLWMPDHGYLPADRPVLEIYRVRNGIPVFLELHVPVVSWESGVPA